MRGRAEARVSGRAEAREEGKNGGEFTIVDKRIPTPTPDSLSDRQRRCQPAPRPHSPPPTPARLSSPPSLGRPRTARSRLSPAGTKMSSIMQYNGAAIIAMAGKDCIAIASDKRYGIRNQTISLIL